MGFEPIPQEALRWEIVLATGWTLEQVDALSEEDFREFWALRHGKNQVDRTNALRTSQSRRR